MNAFFYPVDFITDTGYACAVGRIRALQGSLLTEPDYDRLLTAVDEGDALRVLELAGYAVAKRGEIGEFMRLLTGQVLDLIESLLPDGDKLLRLYFRARYDIINLKAKAKREFAGLEDDPLFDPEGTVSPAVLAEGRLAEITEMLPRPFAEICREYTRRKQEDEIRRMRDIALHFDTGHMELLRAISGDIGSAFVAAFTALRIDGFNLEILYRLRHRGETDTDVFFDGGTVSAETLSRTATEHSPAAVFANTTCGPYARRLDEALREGGDLQSVAAEVHRMQADFLANSRYIAFGPEVIMAYHFSRMTELNNIKTVFLARDNGLDPDEVRKKLEIHGG